MTSSSDGAHILVVDDEPDLVRLVAYNLRKEGYQVHEAYDGTTALRMVEAVSPHLLILDVMLPDKSGIRICEQLKRHTRTKQLPVLMLTARSSEEDRIAGLEAGAEDYVVKPFSPRELVLRVRALMARSSNGSQPTLASALAEEEDIITVGPLHIEPGQHRVLLDGSPVDLSAAEFRLLLVLARYPGRVFTREALLDAVRGHEGAAAVFDRTVDAQIKRLRAKLGETGHSLIRTVRGVGYRLEGSLSSERQVSGSGARL